MKREKKERGKMRKKEKRGGRERTKTLGEKLDGKIKYCKKRKGLIERKSQREKIETWEERKTEKDTDRKARLGKMIEICKRDKNIIFIPGNSFYYICFEKNSCKLLRIQTYFCSKILG
jgi:hypothetical protein